jgi:hypothetical protein
LRNIRNRLTVVLSSLRHNNHITSLNLPFFSRDNGFANTRSEDKVLVDSVDLISITTHTEHADIQLTSSPISPPTGTVMTTNCELSPVQRTVLKSGYCDGKALIACKCFILCSGGDIFECDLIDREKDETEEIENDRVQRALIQVDEVEGIEKRSDAVRRVGLMRLNDILVELRKL